MVQMQADEAKIVAFRRRRLLPLDDRLNALRLSLPHLTRSALPRCLQRHGISRPPDVEGDESNRQIGEFAACATAIIAIHHHLVEIGREGARLVWAFAGG